MEDSKAKIRIKDSPLGGSFPDAIEMLRRYYTEHLDCSLGSQACCLERQLATELYLARVMGCSDLSEAAAVCVQRQTAAID